MDKGWRDPIGPHEFVTLSKDAEVTILGGTLAVSLVPVQARPDDSWPTPDWEVWVHFGTDVCEHVADCATKRRARLIARGLLALQAEAKTWERVRRAAAV